MNLRQSCLPPPPMPVLGIDVRVHGAQNEKCQHKGWRADRGIPRPWRTPGPHDRSVSPGPCSGSQSSPRAFPSWKDLCVCSAALSTALHVTFPTRSPGTSWSGPTAHPSGQRSHLSRQPPSALGPAPTRSPGKAFQPVPLADIYLRRLGGSALCPRISLCLPCPFDCTDCRF